MKVAFFTLGCKVNQYETEYMSELLEKAGFEIVSPDDNADYYIINSCTVTATADRKTRQAVRRFKRNHPESIVILTGCMPQAFAQQAASLMQADIVISNKSDFDIVEIINEYKKNNKRLVRIEKHMPGDQFRPCKISGFNHRIRAFLKIEDGCDRFCSYCVIPISRGRVRSKSLSDLKAEAAGLAENSIKEIVLVGINLSAYGKGENFDIADAVKVCADTPGIQRVRLGSLEPDHITDDIIDRLAAISEFCPQFHLSLQSGCDKTLKSMNRHYTAEEYKNLCGKLRSRFDDATITTDVMVGFTDESEEDFISSLEFVKKIGFEKVHVFPYSERKGTAASRRGDNVPKQEKERRAAVMIEETEKIRQKYLKSLIGSTAEVLFENEVSDGVYQGYTKNYVPVRKKSPDSDLIGSIINVKIVSYFDDCCIAE